MPRHFCVTYSGVSGTSLEKGEATTENRIQQKEEAIFFLSIPRRAQESG